MALVASSRKYIVNLRVERVPVTIRELPCASSVSTGVHGITQKYISCMYGQRPSVALAASALPTA